MARTRRRHTYPRMVQTRKYHRRKRVRDRSGFWDEPPDTKETAYQNTSQCKHWIPAWMFDPRYEYKKCTVWITHYPTYRQSKSQPPLALIVQKRAQRRNKRINKK